MHGSISALQGRPGGPSLPTLRLYHVLPSPKSNESEEVVILIHQDPIYEMVVAHYYSCSPDTANKVLMVGRLRVPLSG